jgi:2-polyprenyl-6-methoxyphenol hydroxylase-like FAD-dependent oxidoreductase
MLHIVGLFAELSIAAIELTSLLALSGAFGSGAAFAFEDAYALSSAVHYVRQKGQPLRTALELYDTIRSPHYKNLVRLSQPQSLSKAD